MTEFAAVAPAYVLVAVNLLLTLAVIRKLRALPAQQSQPAGAEIALPAPGTRLGAVTVTTTDGDRLDESRLAVGDLALLLLTPTCTPCKEAVTKLAGKPQWWQPNLVVAIGGDEDDPATQEMLALVPASVSTVLDPGGALGSALGVTGFPAAILMHDGVVVSADHRPDQVFARASALAASTR